MSDLLGVINLENQKDLLNELTYFRCGAAIPFAGRYRLIDFVMSNMSNAGITEIALFTREKYRSLMDHLGNGKPWNLDRKVGGLFILPPDWHDPTDISMGDLKHFHNNMSFFRRGRAKHVLHADCQHICNIGYRDVFKNHIDTNADITLVYKEVDNIGPGYMDCKRLDIDDHGQVTSVNNENNNKNVYLERFIIRKDILLNLVQYCIAYGKDNFFKDGIMDNLDQYKVNAYRYEGYHSVINSILSYYRSSMGLLDINNYQQLFDRNNTVLTKVKDEAPSKYYDSAKVDNCIVANGCNIKGTVKNCILFREVNIEEGATVRNSIIMQNTHIGKDAVLKNVILDKQVDVSDGSTLIGSEGRPYVIAKNLKV
ncbi:MAG: glucose-1-phosphate adenylyltransferase subunit GlgD [Halanaerobiales bacterium]